jgi:subtilisin family serine protease
VLTDADGIAVLPLATENPAAVRRLAVLPAARYWARHLVRPVLRVTPPGATPRVNRLVLRPLRSPLGALPDWGSEAMGLDRAPLLTVTAARPVRVAILDPGAPAALPFTIASLESEALVEGWSPAVAPPSSAAGLIAAAAPGARVDVLHVGTEPRASALIAAIGWCLSAGIDLLDFGFATPAPCEALAATLARARAQGLVVIAPAGDSSGPVLYPAAERETLAVGALTAPGACPHDAPAPGAPAAAIRGVVLAGFSARGAALDLVAPGTGIVLPGPDGPVAMEGTSLASALVTGFLARLLQTEDDLAGAARCRARADALQAMLRARCRAAGLAAGEGGAGLPLWDPLGTPGTTPDECPSLAGRARRGPLAAARLPA